MGQIRELTQEQLRKANEELEREGAAISDGTADHLGGQILEKPKKKGKGAKHPLKGISRGGPELRF